MYTSSRLRASLPTFTAFFVAVLLAIGCRMPNAATETPPVMPIMPANDAPYTYLALGDSYTIGQSVADTVRWSVQLVKLLRGSGVAMQNAEIIARTGWTCNELQTQGIVESGNHNTYDLVTLLIGVNNQFRGQPIEAFQTDFQNILSSALRFTKGIDQHHVVVLSIPDWGATPYGSTYNRATVSAEIDAFNAVERAECNRLGVRFVDITPISRTALGDASMVASDGLHFSGKMYALWAAQAKAAATAALGK